jgi:hypothetical protein
MMKINQEHKVLLVVEKLGKVMCTVEISTPTYVLLNTQASENQQNQFQRVSKNQLRAMMKRLSLRSFEMPHDKMFVLSFTAVLSEVGRRSLKLLVRRYNEPETNQEKTVFHLKYFSLMVYKKDNYCTPFVHSESCENSRLPREVFIEAFNVFKPVIERSCGENSTLTYQWSIDHFVQQKTLIKLPQEQSNYLRLAPFTFQFDDSSDLFSGFYSVKLTVFESDFVSKRSGNGIWRVRSVFM